jgi:hypothetical protein
VGGTESFPPGDPVLVLFFQRTVGNHVVVVDREWDTSQELSARWTEDTFPTRRLERRAMSCAENVTPVFRQELIVYPIHGHRDVTAAVHVGEQLPLIVYDKTLGLSAIDEQYEFLRVTGENFSDACHNSFGIGH